MQALQDEQNSCPSATKLCANECFVHVGGI